MRKPKEFWLNPNPDNRGWSEGKPDEDLTRNHPPIHVIEKSAYDIVLDQLKDIEAKLDQTEEDFNFLDKAFDQRTETIKKLNDKLKLAITALKKISIYESRVGGPCTEEPTPEAKIAFKVLSKLNKDNNDISK